MATLEGFKVASNRTGRGGIYEDEQCIKHTILWPKAQFDRRTLYKPLKNSTPTIRLKMRFVILLTIAAAVIAAPIETGPGSGSGKLSVFFTVFVC